MRADPFATPGAAAAIDPARLEGVLPRRVFAYLVDLIVIGLFWFVAWMFSWVLTLISFGLLAGGFLLLPVIAPAYHVLTIASGGATWGQRLLGLEITDLLRRPPTLLQAIVQTAAFYFTVFPSLGLALLFVFFLDRRRTLHDWISGLQVLRRVRGGEILTPGRAA